MAFNLSYKTVVVLHVILIVIMLGLVVRIRIQERLVDCNECNLTVIWWQRYGPNEGKEVEFQVPIRELYYGYLNGTCPLLWEETQGYIYQNEIAR